MPCGAFGQRRTREEVPVMTERQEGAMERLCKLSGVMDYDIFSICGKGVGLDAIIGFAIPGVGDVITSGVAFYVFFNIMVHFPRVFKRNWCTLLMNIGFDLAIGLIPIVGDICDVYFHSYTRNTNIVREFYGLPLLDEPKKEDEEAGEGGGDSEGNTNNGNANDNSNNSAGAGGAVDEEVGAVAVATDAAQSKKKKSRWGRKTEE